MEEEVTVREKTKKGPLSYMAYYIASSSEAALASQVWWRKSLKRWNTVRRRNVRGALTFCSARWSGCFKSTNVPMRGKSCGPGGKFLGRLFFTRSIIKRDVTRTTKSVQPFSFSKRETKSGQNWSSILADELTDVHPRKGLDAGVTFAKTGVRKDWKENKEQAKMLIAYWGQDFPWASCFLMYSYCQTTCWITKHRDLQKQPQKLRPFGQTKAILQTFSFIALSAPQFSYGRIFLPSALNKELLYTDTQQGL